MKILYLSCHSILEYDEIKLFTELGHEVFALGSYINPNLPHDPKRPAINYNYNEVLGDSALVCSKENLGQELIDWADVIYIMHKHEWVLLNWDKIKHKKVIWRSIGQSVPDQEGLLALARNQGLKIVRYSPQERTIPNYCGEDAIIRFYKNQNEFSCWHGSLPAVLTVCQSMKQRGSACNYELFKEVTRGVPKVLYGTPSRNPDQSLMDDPLWCGELSYEDLKDAYRKHRVYFYTNTYPASYTLNFIEAMMTGIPIVAIGEKLANLNHWPMQTYEVHKIIEHRVNGFCSDNIEELRGNLEYMLANPREAKRIGEAGRKTACELFGWDVVIEQWKQFFKSL